VPTERIVIDAIHGDIGLNDGEWRVVNTPAFQRLRGLKQLCMGHLTYPNATHTRFAHSLGVFKIMRRITELKDIPLSDDDKADLRLAALLHDIGHYPYSHLMEMVDRVQLTEEIIDRSESADFKEELGLIADIEKPRSYPHHEALGRFIVTQQRDLLEAVGGLDRAERIGRIFSKESADHQLSKLIHSSLDMDRLDFLLRDARAAGVPYGEIDLHYLLNNIRFDPSGRVGVSKKALSAAEHFLMARMFMYRTVYYHKTTFGFEEACRQLLKRCKQDGLCDVPRSGNDIETICAAEDLASFTDSFLDTVIQDAATSSNEIVQALGKTIVSRRAPKLVFEVSEFTEKRHGAVTLCDFFLSECKARLAALAREAKVPIGQFLICSPKPIKIEGA
jgi:HD superfamily phosphohydrolase